jgi:DNA methylase
MAGELSYSDLNLDQWRHYGDIETDSLWLINSRDKTGGHRLEYHGNCVPQIVNQLLRRYTKPGDMVVDLFEGSGTSAIEAARLGRRLVGIDIQPDLVQAVNARLQELDIPPAQCQVLAGNSGQTNWAIPALKQAMQPVNQAQFVFLHPPYADIIRFSDLPGDLSGTGNIDEFNAMFRQVAQTAFDVLEPGRFAAVVIGDCYQGGEWVPLGFYCLQQMNDAGFKTKSIVVKNITGNEKGKGNRQNLWRYRALKGGFYVFKHEYILILQKPRSKARLKGV